jgi:hypothetical protein
MWSRLLYLTLEKATQRKRIFNKQIAPALTGRHRNVFYKELRKRGLPVITEAPKDDSKNQRHKKPKGHKHQLYQKSLMEEKIKSLLPKADEEIIKYRQEKLNDREYGGHHMFMKIFFKELTTHIKSKKDN